MRLRYALDPRQDRRLLDGFTSLWVDVVNAGGAVGFVPPVAAEDVRPEALLHLAAVSEGRTRQLVGFDEHGEVKATAHFTFNTHRLMRHWVGLYTVMVHPRLHGRGLGRELMDRVEREARGFDGIRAIRLTCRGGMGLEHFYASCGYKEVGRAPDALRVGEGEYRDDITMWLSLT